MIKALETRSDAWKKEFKAHTKSVSNANTSMWCRKYQKIAIGDKVMSCYKPSDNRGNENEESKKGGINSFARECNADNCFDSMHRTCIGDYPIGRILQNLINKKNGSSIPQYVHKTHADSCSVCTFK